MAGKQSIDNRGDDNQNQNAQVGRDLIGDIVFNPPRPDPPTAPQPEFDPPKRRLLPLTERWLQAISALITIATTAGIWNAVRVALDDFDAREPLQLWPLYTVMLGLVLSVFGWSVVIFLRKRTSWYPPSGLLPVVAGIQDEHGRGRLAIVRYSGHCPIDGAKLRIYRKPIAWADHYDPTSQRAKREVTDREPAAECRKYERHWWPIDPTDIRDLDGGGATGLRHNR